MAEKKYFLPKDIEWNKIHQHGFSYSNVRNCLAAPQTAEPLANSTLSTLTGIACLGYRLRNAFQFDQDMLLVGLFPYK